MRLDQYLAEYYPERSRSQWQKYILAGHIYVNDIQVMSAKYKLGEDDEVSVKESTTEKKTFEVPVIYEDDNVLVLNKPIGMLTHAKGGIVAEETIADIIKPLTTYAADTNRPGIVHRLDRDTSGVIITVKNPETAALLQKQFTNRTVKKTYLAVVMGSLKHSDARIDLPIERNPKLPSQFRVGASGKAAITDYKTLAEGQNKTAVALMPATGRTHQLRVHMAHLGSPIFGDRVYGKVADRLYLHAWKLEITIPKGQRKVFSAPIPEAFSIAVPEVKAWQK